MSAAPPIRVVAGAILRDDRLLVGQRPEGHRLGLLWEFPGGKVDPGESDREALRRELHEELDVEVVVEELFGEATWDGHTGTILLVGYVCRLVSGEPSAVEHAQIQWIGTDSFHELAWAPADLVLVANLLRHLAPGGASS